MSQLDILLPFGLPPAELSVDLLKELDAPAFATIIARTKSGGPPQRERFDSFSRALPHEIWLARQFGLKNDHSSPSIAASLMQALRLPPASGTWFVLHPVHIHIARDHLVLTDPRQLVLTEAESRALFDIAKALFQETGKNLVFGNASTWFLRADDWDTLQTSTPDAATGHNIDIWMPKGQGEREWRKVQNEIQMHWFNHPINENREMHRQRSINSLWLWGGGTTVCTPGHYTHSYNLSDWANAFSPYVTSPGSAATASSLLASRPERGLLLLDALLEPALANDWGSWLAAVRDLEANWFAPLLFALKSGAIHQLALHISHDSCLSRFVTTPSSLRKFWIKPSLAKLCP